MSIGASVLARWDAAGLDSSVAPLYRGAPDPSDPFSLFEKPGQRYGSTPLDEAELTLPRAEFVIGPEDRIIDSVACRIIQALVVFKVWDTDLDTVEGYMETIEGLFDNSDRAATSPLSHAGWHIVSARSEGNEAWVIEDELCIGVGRYEVTWSKPNSVPG